MQKPEPALLVEDTASGRANVRLLLVHRAQRAASGLVEHSFQPRRGGRRDHDLHQPDEVRQPTPESVRLIEQIVIAAAQEDGLAGRRKRGVTHDLADPVKGLRLPGEPRRAVRAGSTTVVQSFDEAARSKAQAVPSDRRVSHDRAVIVAGTRYPFPAERPHVEELDPREDRENLSCDECTPGNPAHHGFCRGPTGHDTTDGNGQSDEQHDIPGEDGHGPRQKAGAGERRSRYDRRPDADRERQDRIPCSRQTNQLPVDLARRVPARIGSGNRDVMGPADDHQDRWPR